MTGNHDPRELLQTILNAVQRSIDPIKLLQPHLKTLDPHRHYKIFGAGKAVARMALACEQVLPDISGVVITPYGYGCEPRKIDVIQAAHPVPDEKGEQTTRLILEACRRAQPDDFVLMLLSGGASSLLVQPVDRVTLEDKKQITELLLRCGASINEINIVRKHLSKIKGGRLAAVTKATMLTFAISDVPHDDPAVIGSGPTVPDYSTLEEARGILGKYAIDPAPAILAALADPANETPRKRSKDRHSYEMIGGPQTAIMAARGAAEVEGYAPVMLGIEEGEAAEVARRHFRIAKNYAKRGQRTALISGGELSVTLKRSAIETGGRCREYMLALAAEAMNKAPWLSGAAWDTDGIDGKGGETGAFIFSDTYERAHAQGIDLEESLENHASGRVFIALNDSIAIGPTLTNVGDMRVLLIDPR